jgi:hypothetical protein
MRGTASARRQVKFEELESTSGEAGVNRRSSALCHHDGHTNHGATWPVSILMIALALITMVAVLFAKETAPALAKSRGCPGEG